jgi:hypothetical protein
VAAPQDRLQKWVSKIRLRHDRWVACNCEQFAVQFRPRLALAAIISCRYGFNDFAQAGFGVSYRS